MSYWIFYYLAIFSEKAVILLEKGKKPFLGPKSFLKVTIFSKKATFLEKMEKILEEHDHFLGEGVILREKWI